MLNGRCKVWKDDDGNFHMEANFDAPNGRVKMRRSASVTDSVAGWDPRAPETGPGTLIKKKVEFIAGFFPTKEMVGEHAFTIAATLMKRRSNPETSALAQKQIDAVKAAAIAGDDEAFDIDYALRQMAKGARREQMGSMYSRGVLAGDDDFEDLNTFDASLVSPQTEIGFRLRKPKLKKLASWVKKNPVKAIASAALPPVAAYNLLRAGKRRNPAAIQTIAEVRRVAEGLPPTPEAPVPAPAIVEQAQMAVENLRTADALDAEGVGPEFQAKYVDAAEEYGDYDPYSDTTVEGDEIGSFLGSLKKKLRGAVATIDPTKKGSFMAPLLSNLPVVGPGVKASLDLLDQAKKLNPSAIEKVKTVKTLAAAGVPKALAAEANLKAAQELSKEAEKLAAKGASIPGGKKSWFPFSGIYRAGLTRSVA